MSIKSKLLLLLLLAVGCWTQSATIELDKDITLNITGSRVNGSLIGTVDPILSVNKSDATKGQRTSLILDLTYNSLLVPNKATAGFGIICSADLLCEAGIANTTSKYRDQQVQSCTTAKTVLRFNEKKVENRDIDQIDFALFETKPEWEAALGKNGVIGLGPLSPLWDYIVSAYDKEQAQEDIEVTVSYKLKNPETAALTNTIELTKDSRLTINGRTGINEPVVRKFDLSKYNRWVFEEASLALSGGSEKQESVNLCVDNTRPVFFFVLNAAKVKSGILKQLCGVEDKCSKSTSDLKKVDSMKVSFFNDEDKKKTFTMEIKPQEFINFDEKDQAVIAIEEYSNSAACAEMKSEDSVVTNGVGLLFLTKVEFVIKIFDKDDVSIGFNETEYPNDTIFLIILIVLGAMILAIIIGIVVTNMVKKKSPSSAAQIQEDGAYAKAEDN